MSEIKSIPLERFHAEKGARFVPFAGWNMPVQYTSIIREHLAVRQKVGMFDVSHMGEVILSGKQCEGFLNYLLTNDYSNLEVGKSRYSMMCYEDGGVVDDLIVYRLADERYLICVNAGNTDKDFDWMLQQAASFDVTLENKSVDYSLLAIQGPEAVAFLEPLVLADLSQLGRFQHVETPISGKAVILSRTGYTGEDGFEIYIPAADSESVCKRIAERAEELQLEDFYCGLGCRDSLRLEAGYPLYGHEISDKIDPITAGLGWTVKLKKTSDFIGKKALAEIKAGGVTQKVKFFCLSDRRIARQDEPIWCGDSEVGKVLSGTFSPVIERAMGSALIDSNLAESDKLEVRMRGNPFELALVKPPIHINAI